VPPRGAALAAAPGPFQGPKPATCCRFGPPERQSRLIHRCSAEAEVLASDSSAYAAGWDIANRESWEQADRMLICMLIDPDFSAWTGASGLVPTEGPATTAA
jgi:hypothetical protein